jgi:hypothetical protein
MGIAIHNLSASGTITESLDLAAGVRQDASGIFGTTVRAADLVIADHFPIIIFDSRKVGYHTGHPLRSRWISIHWCRRGVAYVSNTLL